MTLRAGLALALLALVADSVGWSEQFENGYPTADVRAFGAICNGSTDDEGAFERGITRLSGLGGGTLVVPGGKTCMVDADVAMASNVTIKGEPGSIVKADGTFTNGVFSGSAVTNVSFLNLTIDLNGERTSAIYTAGNSYFLTVDEVEVYGGDNAASTAYSLINLTCNDASTHKLCARVERSRITCATHANETADTGIYVDTNANDQDAIVVNANVVEGCDANSIYTEGDAFIEANLVRAAAGAAAVGIAVAGDNSEVWGNRVFTSGSAARAFWAGGSYQQWGMNYAEPNGIGATIAYDFFGATLTVAGNGYFLGNSTTGSAVGVKITGGYSVISAMHGYTNNSLATHIISGGQQTTIEGVWTFGGRYGIVPPGGSSLSDVFGSSANTRIKGGQITFICAASSTCDSSNLDSAAVMVVTGWHVEDLLCNWGGPDSVCIRLGDTRQYTNDGYGCSLHTLLSGLQLHCASCTSLIATTPIGERCVGGSTPGQNCNSLTGSACSGGSCQDVACTGISISGGQCYMATSEKCIDFGTNFTSAGGENPIFTNTAVGGVQMSGPEASDEFIDFGTGGTSTNFSGFEIGCNYTGVATPIANWSTAYGKNLCLARTACFQAANVSNASDDILVGWAPADPVKIIAMGCLCYDPNGGADGTPYNCDGATKASIQLEDRAGNAIGSSVGCSTGTSDITYTTFGTPGSLNKGEAIRFDTTNSPSDTDETYQVCFIYE